MSPRRKSRSRKISKQKDIELTSILKFVKFIQLLAGGMLGISILGLILVGKDIEAQVLYVMVIITNLLIVLVGLIPIRLLERRSKDIVRS